MEVKNGPVNTSSNCFLCLKIIPTSNIKKRRNEKDNEIGLCKECEPEVKQFSDQYRGLELCKMGLESRLKVIIEKLEAPMEECPTFENIFKELRQIVKNKSVLKIKNSIPRVLLNKTSAKNIRLNSTSNEDIPFQTSSYGSPQEMVLRPELFPEMIPFRLPEDGFMPNDRPNLPEAQELSEFQCYICRKLFEDDNTFQSHLKRYPNRGKECPHCPKVFHLKRELQSHIVLEHPEVTSETHQEEEVAIECQPELPEEVPLDISEVFIQNVKQEANAEGSGFDIWNTKLKCSVCKKRFPDKATLRTHFLRHLTAKPFHCKYCFKSFNRKYYLTCHTRQFHAAEVAAAPKFKCDICHRSFDDEQAFQAHLKLYYKQINKQRPPNECPQCSRVFHRKSDLKRHIRIHSEERPFICPHCSQAFREKQTLKVHISGKHLNKNRQNLEKVKQEPFPEVVELSHCLELYEADTLDSEPVPGTAATDKDEINETVVTSNQDINYFI